MEMQFYPIDVDYVTNKAGKAVIRLFGRSTDGKRVCVIDSNFEPYFYAVPESKTKVASIRKEMEKIRVKHDESLFYVSSTEVSERKYLGKDISAIKVVVNHPKAVPAVKDIVKKISGIAMVAEADITFEKRYLIDKKISTLVLCSVNGEEFDANADVDLVLEAKSIEQTGEEMLSPKILGFDIEVYNKLRIPREEKDPILMVGFYSDNFKKVITWKKLDKAEKYIHFVKDEKELILEAVKTIKEFKPDYLVGYFSDGFDFPYLRSRAKKNNVELNINLDFSKISFRKRGELSSVQLTGFAHLDIYRFIKRITSGGEIQLESYDLDTVAKEMLNEGKADVEIPELAGAWDDNNQKKLKEFCKYNLKDAELTFRLTEKMLPNLHEFTKIIGQPVQDICRMTFGQFVEGYLLRNIQQFRELVPNRPSYNSISDRSMDSYEGAFVYQPSPGLYENLAVFDFRSLYPTIITSHNICPSTLTLDSKNAYETPEIEVNKRKIKHYFTSKHEGFIPIILRDILTRRNRIKEIIKKNGKDPILDARQYSLKILANSFYGYLGFPGGRWYSLECAQSVTAYARNYVQQVIEKAKKEFEVVYGDTDSIFIRLGKKTKKDALDFLKEINRGLPSLMELELENFYVRGIFVSKKSETKGAKKKYALIDEKGSIKVRGFETIRGDWSILAKEVQEKVLDMVLKENAPQKAINFVKEIIKQARQKKIDMKKMIIRRNLTKEIKSYEQIGPHVAVAKKMIEQGAEIPAGTTIYYIINEGKGMIRDRAKLPEESSSYDSEYYVNNQVIPAVKSIFEALGYKETYLKEDHAQSKLGEF